MPVHSHGSAAGLVAWNETISRTLTALWDRLLWPLHERLVALGVSTGGNVVLVPSGKLSPLPLHAAGVKATDGSWSCFMDRWTVSYAPSLQAVVTSRSRAVEPVRQGHTLLAVTNPLGPDDAHSDLQVEENPACRYFDADKVKHLRREEATVAQVRSLMASASYLSFFCHGHWSPHDPDASHLQLAGGQLTVADFRHLKLTVARHVWLGACESGLPGLRNMADEFQGLPSVLMQAGAPGISATLWPVFNRHTEALMHNFYDHHRQQGQSPTVAMRAAVQNTRAAITQNATPTTELRLRAAVAKPNEPFSVLSFRQAADPTRQSAQAHSIFYDTTQPIHWAAFISFGA